MKKKFFEKIFFTNPSLGPELLFITCGRDPHCEGRVSPSKHFLLNHRQYTMIPPILTNIPCWVSPDKRNNSTRDCHNTQRATSVPTEPGHCVLSMIQQICLEGERCSQCGCFLITEAEGSTTMCCDSPGWNCCVYLGEISLLLRGLFYNSALQIELACISIKMNNPIRYSCG